MTMNYCGRCGAANGTAARYCRQCGAELHNQAAVSSSSTPLNVEFSARSITKENRSNRFESVAPASPEKVETGKLNQPKAASKEIPPQTPATTPPVSAEETNDPKAISESLKRIRASGPLIVEAVKKKQERINQIIAESISTESKSEAKNGKKSGRLNDAKGTPAEAQTQLAPSAKTQFASSALPQTTAVTQRRATGALMQPASQRFSDSAVNGNHGQLPPQGPSSVLAQASGLEKNPNLGSKLRISLIAALVIIAASGYFLLRDRLSTPSHLLGAGRNLKSVEEQSSDLVKLGQRDREQGHYDSAIGYFQNALTLTPNNLETRFLLAQTQLSAGQTDDALRNYSAILRAVPEHLEARLQIAEIYRAAGNWTAALPEYKRVIAFDQTTPQAAFALEAIESYLSNKGTAEPPVQRKGVIPPPKPIDLPGKEVVADVTLSPPLMSSSIASIKPPVASKPEEKPDPRIVADGHKKLGLRYYNVREYPAAIKEFLSAYRLNPEDKDLLYFIGSCYYGLEQFALAHDYFVKVDSGNYVGVAQSNAARTEKAAKEEYKRRQLMKGDQLNQVKIDPNQKNKGTLNGLE
ncbi:MAG: tetratricopeptide repeat protein [Acidobacteria bacterium]|nr:tetratricopeptide repeat protein [Acidobacteriota bacterium]